MPVSQNLVDTIGKKYGVASPSNVKKSTPSTTPKQPSKPTVFDAVKDVTGAVNKGIQAVPQVIKKTSDVYVANKPLVDKINAQQKQAVVDAKQQALKESLKTMPLEARNALRKYAVPTANGFMLPSVDDPDLVLYEGLTFTNDEWKRDYSAKTTSPTTIGVGTGKEQKIDSTKEDIMQFLGDVYGNIQQGNAAGALSRTAKATQNTIGNIKKAGTDEEIEFWKDAESQRAANARRDQITAREEAAGLDYLAKLRAARPVDEGYRSTDWSNPLTYAVTIGSIFNPAIGKFNEVVQEGRGSDASETDAFYRVGNETEKAFKRGIIEMKKSLGGAAETMFADEPYFKWASTLGAQIADDARIELLKRRDLATDVTLAGQSNYLDPAYYTTAFASAIPHFVGSTISSGAGALAGSFLAGPAGTFAGTAMGAYAYSSSAESGQMYNQMLESGYSLKEAREGAAVYGAVAGGLDALMPGELGGKIINGISKKMLVTGIRQSVKKEVMARTKDLLFDALKEGGTEAAQQFMQNVVMNFYGENQDIWDNVVDSFVGGATVGGVVSIIEPKGSGDHGAGGDITQGIGQETTNDATIRPQPVNVGATDAGATVREITQSITEAQHAAAAYDAAIQLGDKLIANGVPEQLILPLQEEARQAQRDLNDATHIEVIRHIEATKEPVIENETINMEVGTTPTGEFSARGSIVIGEETLTIPFSANQTFPTKEEAVLNSVGQLKSWVVQQLGTAGVTNERAVQDAVTSLEKISDDVQRGVFAENADVGVQLDEGGKTNTQNMGKIEKSIKKAQEEGKSFEEWVSEYTTQDYRGVHQIDTSKSSKVTEISDDTLGSFIEEYKRQYGYPSLKVKDLNKLKSLIKNSGEDVIVYRASPQEGINDGDWVTIDRTYANDIKRQNGGKVYSYTVSASDLLYPNTLEGFKELPSLSKWGSFQFQSSELRSELKAQWDSVNQAKKEVQGDTKKRPAQKGPLTLYHGTAEQIDGKLQAVSDEVGILWTAMKSDVADSYIPDERKKLYVDRDALLQSPDTRLVDKNTNVPRWIFNKENRKFVNDLGIDIIEQPDNQGEMLSFTKQTASEIVALLDKAATSYNADAGMYVFGDKKKRGTGKMYRLTLRDGEKLKIKDLRRDYGIFGEEQADTDRLEDFQKAKEDGYDGVRILDFSHTDEKTILHESIGLFQGGLDKMEQEIDGKPTKKQQATDELVSRVSERMTEQYPELGNPVVYQKMGIKEEIEKAAKMMETDKEQAYRIAMGIEEVPAHEQTAVNITMTDQALKEGNYTLAAQLIKHRSLRQTDFGQSIVLEKASVNDNSPQRYMKELLAERFNKVGKSYTEGLKESMLKKSSTERVLGIIDEEITKAKRVISKKKQLDIQQAQDFIASLACK